MINLKKIKLLYISCIAFCIFYELLKNTIFLQGSNVVVSCNNSYNSNVKYYDISSSILSSSFSSLVAMQLYSNSSYSKFFLYGNSFLITCSAVFILKHMYHKLRPDCSDTRSFPSGHAAITFVSLLHIFYKRKYFLIGVPLSIVVCLLRVVALRHFIFDVLCGCFLAMFVTVLVNIVYEFLLKKLSFFK
jgi:membrane-associated phospholipid phosphatase